MAYIALVLYIDGERHFQWFNEYKNAKDWLDSQYMVDVGTIISTEDTENLKPFL